MLFLQSFTIWLSSRTHKCLKEKWENEPHLHANVPCTMPCDCSKMPHLCHYPSFTDIFPLRLFPQSRHQQGPLLRDAGNQEEEGVVHEEAVELLFATDVALDRAVGGVWGICLPRLGRCRGHSWGLLQISPGDFSRIHTSSGFGTLQARKNRKHAGISR